MARKHLTDLGTLLAIANYTGFFVGLCVFGWLVSRKKWQPEHAALLQEIRRREHQLENG